MKTFIEILREKSTVLKLKKSSKGYYTAQIGRIDVQIYKAELADYWSSTITVGKYGDDDWQEESIQGSTKKEVVMYVKKFIDKLGK